MDKSGRKLGIVKADSVDIIDGVETVDIVDLEYGLHVEKS